MMSVGFNINDFRTIQNAVVGYKLFQSNYLLIFEKPKKEYECFLRSIIGSDKPLTSRIFLSSRTLSNLTNTRTDAFKLLSRVLENEIDKDQLLFFLNEVIIDIENLNADVFKRQEVKTQQQVVLTKEVKEKAEELLRAPDLLKRIINILEQSVVGEEKNKLISFLLSLSGQTEYPQIIIFKGSSTGGKTRVANCVTEPFADKVWKIGRLSKTALDYKADLDDYTIIYLQEMSEEESGGHFRLMSNRDGGYHIAITVKEGDSFDVFEKDIPAKTIIITSTAYEFEEQLETRAWIINVDESVEQTKRIIHHKINGHKNEIKEALGIKKPSLGFKILNATTNMLKQCIVCVPYIDALEDVFEKTSLRIRADFDKFIDLIKLCAYLHQYQRPSIELDNGKLLIFATFQDLEYVRLLADDILLSTISGLDKRVKEVYGVVCDLMVETKTLNSKVKENSENTGEKPVLKDLEITVKDVAVDMSPLSQDRVYKILETLVKRGKLLKHKKEGHGNKNFYALPPSDKAIGVLEMRIPPYSTLEESVRTTLEDYSLTNSLNTYYMCITERGVNSPLSKEIDATSRDEPPTLSQKEKPNSLLSFVDDK